MRKWAFVLGAACLFTVYGISHSAEVIQWDEAPKYYGQWVTVKGKIVSTQNTGQIIFLNFGPKTGKDFTVLIFSPSFHRFPDKPQDFYHGKHVLVTGKIQEYKGTHSITIPDSSRIEILKEDTKKEDKGN